MKIISTINNNFSIKKFNNYIDAIHFLIENSNNINDFDFINELDAVHRSPYDFDKFNVSKIGSGEGHQVHGWGLYFSLNTSSTGKKYNESIKNANKIITYKGKSYKRTDEKSSIQYDILYAIKNGNTDDVNELFSRLRDKYNNKNDYKKLDVINNLYSNLSKINPDDITIQNGQIYNVELPELEYYIDENKPFKKQSDIIQQSLNKLFIDKNIKTKNSDLGRDIYLKIKKQLNISNKDTSTLLNKYGIAGIKYNGFEDGDCVVIFNHDDVKIINKEYDYKTSKKGNTFNSNQTSIKDYIKQLNYLYDTGTNKTSIPENIQLQILKTSPKLGRSIKNLTQDSIMYYVSHEPNALKYINHPTTQVISAALKFDKSNIKYVKNIDSNMLIDYLSSPSSRMEIISNVDSNVLMDVLDSYKFTDISKLSRFTYLLNQNKKDIIIKTINLYPLAVLFVRHNDNEYKKIAISKDPSIVFNKNITNLIGNFMDTFDVQLDYTKPFFNDKLVLYAISKDPTIIQKNLKLYNKEVPILNTPMKPDYIRALFNKRVIAKLYTDYLKTNDETFIYLLNCFPSMFIQYNKDLAKYIQK